MTARPELLQLLRRLDELDTARGALENHSTQFAPLTAEIEAVRQHLPTAILKHYDQRRALNRPAVAPARGGICGACHTSMTRGSSEELHRSGDAIHVCENCGVFIYLDDREPGAAHSSSTR
jgi:predicted  nucleic acid-binding Zn-ribbon protein